MPVLQRKELEESPLADLHTLASEIGIEGYRVLKRDQLIDAILDVQGGEPEGRADDAEPDEAEPEDGEPEAEPDEVPADETLDTRPPEGEEVVEEEPEVQSEPTAEEEEASGVLDVLPNGSGFIRIDPGDQARDDVYVSPAQIRRCELRAGDFVSGPVREPRRNERHPSLVRVEAVNGGPAEPPEERPRFNDLTPVFPSERLPAPAALEGVPYGKGSRVAIGGPPGAGATSLLREIVAVLVEREPEVELSVALVGVRPEEVTEWRRDGKAAIYGGGFDRSYEAHAQAVELAIERGKRAAERGRDAVVAIDSLEWLQPGAQRRVFGAARKLEEAGSLTVVATVGMSWEPQRYATTRVLLDPPAPESGGVRVAASRSATLRGDLLA